MFYSHDPEPLSDNLNIHTHTRRHTHRSCFLYLHSVLSNKNFCTLLTSHPCGNCVAVKSLGRRSCPLTCLRWMRMQTRMRYINITNDSAQTFLKKERECWVMWWNGSLAEPALFLNVAKNSSVCPGLPVQAASHAAWLGTGNENDFPTFQQHHTYFWLTSFTERPVIAWPKNLSLCCFFRNKWVVPGVCWDLLVWYKEVRCHRVLYLVQRYSHFFLYTRHLYSQK